MLIIKRNIIILGKGPTYGLDYTTIKAVAEYSINFTEQQKEFVFKSTPERKQQFLIY